MSNGCYLERWANPSESLHNYIGCAWRMQSKFYCVFGLKDQIGWDGMTLPFEVFGWDLRGKRAVMDPIEKYSSVIRVRAIPRNWGHEASPSHGVIRCLLASGAAPLMCGNNETRLGYVSDWRRVLRSTTTWRQVELGWVIDRRRWMDQAGGGGQVAREVVSHDSEIWLGNIGAP